ncbi:KGK domain-containing protein [Oscillatoria sp. HE19RPO]|uniref:KGK domain-containing protein n=1 Tax=Oscillatoria sp. HE19RPO TaxID=2954806 RepID=UPI0020C28684|nr:KGK domain-containing protein [Oscillatoria sp. HE19RPO]
MSNNFEPLRADEVVSVNESFKILVNHPTFKTHELTDALITLLKNADAIFRAGKVEEKMKWFNEGVNVQVLRYGASGWQKGRIKISVEFCPDEPEGQKTSTPNQPETSAPESPLDEIRRMQG